MLAHALTSVALQELQACAIVVEYDHLRTGAAETKNRALSRATSEFVAFLDDDDEFLPDHLRLLRQAADEEHADVVYSLPRVINREGHQVARQFDWGGGYAFDADYLRRKAHIQTTCLVRTSHAKAVGGFEFVTDETGSSNDDHGFFLKLLDNGSKFHHVHLDTFVWRHHGYGTATQSGNTSGQPTRW